MDTKAVEPTIAKMDAETIEILLADCVSTGG